MPSYSVATTKDNLSSLIDKALAGEEVIVTRHGKPTIAFRVVDSVDTPRRTRAESLKWLKQRRATRSTDNIDGAVLVCEMRDDGAH